jgi:hypothetical protein
MHMTIFRGGYFCFLMIYLVSFPRGSGLAADLHSPVRTETIVAIRHGEKPPNSLGQLSCKGLNRSLALPSVLLTRYGRPNFIFAPNPSVRSTSASGTYSYVRPLATIEPTAIEAHLPVNTQIGLGDIHRLQRELTSERYRNSLVFIAWEHAYLDKFAKALVKDYKGDSTQVPFWLEVDYDSIFVIRLSRKGNHRSVVFRHEQEGLTDHLSNGCPNVESQAAE